MTKYKDLNCILLVDDDEVLNFLHSEIIRRSGIEVNIKVTKDGMQAMEYLQKGNNKIEPEEYPMPGLIFLDINMPRMNGWEFLEEYDRLPKNLKEHIVVEMLTSSINPDDEKKAISNDNVSGFFTKPLHRENFVKIIEEYFPETIDSMY